MSKRRCKGKTRVGKRCERRGVEWCAQHADQAPAHTERTPKKARARKKDDWRPRFLAAFEEHITVSEACRVAGVSRRNVYDERARNADFDEAWKVVEERTTEAMEREGYRRAVEGWVEREEFVLNEDGERVPTLVVRKWSDTLLIFLLKARRPGVYREQHRIELGGVDGAPIAAEILTVGAKEAADASHDFLKRIAGPSA